MNELQPNSTELDKYLYSLIEMLRTKYYNVSVNRGRTATTFYYNIKEGLKPYKWECIIPNTEILGYYMTSETPPQILNLLK